jgi:hypothetical protein
MPKSTFLTWDSFHVVLSLLAMFLLYEHLEAWQLVIFTLVILPSALVLLHLVVSTSWWPSWLAAINFLLLQWFTLRLGKDVIPDRPDDVIRWRVLHGIMPLTGWWSPYRRLWGTNDQALPASADRDLKPDNIVQSDINPGKEGDVVVNDLPSVHLVVSGHVFSAEGTFRGLRWAIRAEVERVDVDAARTSICVAGELPIDVTIHAESHDELPDEVQAVAAALLWSRLRAVVRDRHHPDVSGLSWSEDHYMGIVMDLDTDLRILAPRLGVPSTGLTAKEIAQRLVEVTLPRA